jgi:predicted aspartyl protease
MRTHVTRAVFFLTLAGCVAGVQNAAAQTQAASTEIPFEHCDVLPVMTVKIAGVNLRFLVDTGATSMLNLGSVTAGSTKKIEIASWTGVSSTHGREAMVSQLSLGDRTLKNLKMDAVDLSPIAKACGGPIDGILGVDLLERLGVTLDLKRNVARLGSGPSSGAENSMIAEMDSAMHGCSDAFNSADAESLTRCFDPNFEWSMPSGEIHGRGEASAYLRENFFRAGQHGHYSMKVSDQRAVGSVVWTLYDFSIDSGENHRAGKGMMICRKTGGRWFILSMHETLNSETASIPSAN